ncbi:MAG TPA: sulfur oxidation c-type cytochrome SoxX [Burkholderiales bacterium]|nr:sulfur oxidation c-type cytochrome SoxX [Burkholderiales bacterium]
MVTVPRVENDTIPEPLTKAPGDARRGREIVTGREANCLFCHALPEPGLRFMGNVGPPLAGIAKRLSAGQMRLRIVDPTLANREAAMPAYYRTGSLNEVAQGYRGRPILTAQEIEDVIAYLRTLN